MLVKVKICQVFLRDIVESKRKSIGISEGEYIGIPIELLVKVNSSVGLSEGYC